MLISNLKTENMFVELLDKEAESISGGISVKADELNLSFKNVALDIAGFKIFLKKGFINLTGVELSV
ncbi:hypothetical protein IQ229_22200 [Nostoc cf. edaphicum LEGE 07299]|uniref:Uncharacterized protein n=1 Tax=Nostoc cf. edaphicum LEGE 07299 TaxID=2777974 RepID=A0ABR9U4E6_9NOSO|nr:hypothetical protein [Nostoc edaphicum]MBE9107539.1 hypothetical protein [Nostoc cf. edaphicum LEGE 07299]